MVVVTSILNSLLYANYCYQVHRFISAGLSLSLSVSPFDSHTNTHTHTHTHPRFTALRKLQLSGSSIYNSYTHTHTHTHTHTQLIAGDNTTDAELRCHNTTITEGPEEGQRYSIYWLYWYKSTNTDAAAALYGCPQVTNAQASLNSTKKVLNLLALPVQEYKF
jgi:hypothetical protein